MNLLGVTRNGLAPLCVLTAYFLMNGLPASATGIMHIHHPSGKINTYDDVKIKVIHSALYLTSADGKGTLVINRAACSYQGKLLVCFATSATLVQSGETSLLDLKTGTIYLNDTDDPQPLVLSSSKVPAHGIIMSLTTTRGTYISLSGRIDSVMK